MRLLRQKIRVGGAQVGLTERRLFGTFDEAREAATVQMAAVQAAIEAAAQAFAQEEQAELLVVVPPGTGPGPLDHLDQRSRRTEMLPPQSERKISSGRSS